ncbi:uncharacterized protein LOC135697499 [Ochlerotatus camptorhynchus]|uniref:uncharacterized protein LOC135697499 n=1 Tax=Ochlerotatus camptorhynchus TaxID=644619 RepID=UPI0031D49715
MRRIKGGFTFPIAEGDEVERLERTVLENPEVRQEYIKLLKRKPDNVKIVSYLPHVFSDEALEGYNYNGASALGRSKLAMKAYEIFSNCFLEAYESEGMKLHDLASQISSAIKQSRNRMRQRTFRAKKSIKKMLNAKSEN